MNLEVKIEKRGNVEGLAVWLPLNPRTSKSGKSTVIASTNGNAATSAQYKGAPVILGLNAYVK